MTNLRQRPSALVWIVWGVAELFYIIAVFNRTSFATLGPTAQQHFGIDATVLSSFAVLQLVVYAGMQIPVGALLDRFGVSIILISGGTIMLVGQLGLALADQVWLAVAFRMLVGAGDACTFIGVIRLLVDWFPLRMIPIMSQITGMLGHVGQILSVLPLSLAVGAFGWAAGFTGVAAVGGIVVILGIIVLRDRPGTGTVVERLTGKLGRTSRESAKLLDSMQLGMSAMPSTTEAISTTLGQRGKMRTILGIPGVRLAFWVHFTPPFSQQVFLWLWGTPFLIGGVGLTGDFVAGLLIYMVFTGAIAGLTFGRLTSRFAQHRVRLVLTVIVSIALSWAVVLLWPGTPPTWLIVIMATVLSTGGAASLISFEVNRTYAPRRMSGLATGLVNMGGFIATLLMMFIVGLTLDLQGAGEPETYRLDAFKIAFATQAILWILGITMILVERRNATRWLQERGRSV